MSAPDTQSIVDSFTAKLAGHLDQTMLDGPIRLDNTHTVVIIPLKEHGRIHAHVQGGINDRGLENVLSQIRSVPSLKGLVQTALK